MLKEHQMVKRIPTPSNKFSTKRPKAAAVRELRSAKIPTSINSFTTMAMMTKKGTIKWLWVTTLATGTRSLSFWGRDPLAQH